VSYINTVQKLVHHYISVHLTPVHGLDETVIPIHYLYSIYSFIFIQEYFVIITSGSHFTKLYSLSFFKLLSLLTF
jgi:hypothetical protein